MYRKCWLEPGSILLQLDIIYFSFEIRVIRCDRANLDPLDDDIEIG